MAKLILLFTALALFLLISNTSIYEADVNNRAPQQSKCKNEIHQQHQLRACHQWFHKRAQRVQSAYIAAEKFEVITEDDPAKGGPASGHITRTAKTTHVQDCRELAQLLQYSKSRVLPLLRKYLLDHPKFLNQLMISY